MELHLIERESGRLGNENERGCSKDGLPMVYWTKILVAGREKLAANHYKARTGMQNSHDHSTIRQA